MNQRQTPGIVPLATIGLSFPLATVGLRRRRI
jgi:hypothetical protein